MNFPVTNLDDRRFQDIVDEAKSLIPTFCPEWTAIDDHDPGVAIIELFAWMSEMLIHRLNQVPDVFFTRMLNLMGAAPYPARAAHADLTFWIDGALDDAVVIPSGTEVMTGGDDPVVFATIDDVSIVPSELTAILIGTSSEDVIDWTDELRGGLDAATAERLASIGLDASDVAFEDPERSAEVLRSLGDEPDAGDDGALGVPCFGELVPGTAMYLGFERSMAGCAIRIDMEMPLVTFGVRHGEEPVVWEASVGEDWMRSVVADDTTGYLTRSGSLTLLVGSFHDASTLGGVRAHWVRVRLVQPGSSGGYRISPRVARVDATTVGGTAVAEHSRSMPGEVLGISDGRPDQRFGVSGAPVLERRPGETVRTFHGDEEEEWTEVESFLDSGAADRHFMWDAATGEIRFGPFVNEPHGGGTQHGAVPAAGAQVTVAAYRTGGGAAGNVAARTLTTMKGEIPFVDRVENLFSAVGGVNAETIENAKVRLPALLGRGEQLVTASDYERACFEADRDVVRAWCLAPPPGSAGAAVRLLVVPRVGVAPERRSIDDLALGAATYDRLVEHLDARRILGANVDVGSPFYRGVSVAALLTVLPGRPEEAVRDRALEALYRFLDPVVGGWSGRGWPVATDLRQAPLFALLEGVDGVERVEQILLFDVDARERCRVGSAVSSLTLAPDELFLSIGHRVVTR